MCIFPLPYLSRCFDPQLDHFYRLWPVFVSVWILQTIISPPAERFPPLPAAVKKDHPNRQPAKWAISVSPIMIRLPPIKISDVRKVISSPIPAFFLHGLLYILPYLYGLDKYNSISLQQKTAYRKLPIPIRSLSQSAEENTASA